MFVFIAGGVKDRRSLVDDTNAPGFVLDAGVNGNSACVDGVTRPGYSLAKFALLGKHNLCFIW